ncbi:hypothetical protein MTO96_037730 [Rhipicephalus appendiculatus]
MAPVIKRETPEASSSQSTVDLRKSQDAKQVELRKVVNFARKHITEHKWQNWCAWNSERQYLEKQKKPKPKPAASKSQSSAGQKPAAIKNEKPDHTVEDEFKISYRCESCDRLFPKKLELEWHLREHTGVRPLPCGLCPMKFLNGRLLAAHHTRHHGLGSKWKRCGAD